MLAHVWKCRIQGGYLQLQETEKKKKISFSNSHFLLGSLSYYATNLKLCQSHTSAVRQALPPSQVQKRNVQDVFCPPGLAPCSAAENPASRGSFVFDFD